MPSLLPLEIHAARNFILQNLWERANSRNVIFIYGFGSCYSGWRISKMWADQTTGGTASLQPAAEAVIPLKLYFHTCRIECQQVMANEKMKGDILGIPHGDFPKSIYKPNPWNEGYAKKQLLLSAGTPQTRKYLPKSAKICHAWLKQQAFTMLSFNTFLRACNAPINN